MKYRIKQGKQNNKLNLSDFLDIKDVKRMSIAPVCPYWSPVMPEKYEIKNFENVNKRSYIGLGNTKFNFYQRKKGCKFYEQFNSYIDSDVIVFNSLKYKLESAMNRKPLTEVEIIDECDEFLDSFSNQKTINIDRLQNALRNIFETNEESVNKLNEIREIINHLKKNTKVNNEILELKRTGIYDLFRILLNSGNAFENIDEESYLFNVEETAKMFEGFLYETYVSFEKKDNVLLANIVTTNLEKRFKEMKEKNKTIVLMSGTLHSKEVLKKVFGLDDFDIIEAETGHQGQINVLRSGFEIDCRYSNFSSGKFTRKEYLTALSKCVEKSKRPVLIHVNAFLDLPSEEELERFDINNLISREKLREIQNDDKKGILVERFKKGQTDVLFTTRSSRGIDFPGNECNSIIFTKYPNPNVQDSFWKILHKTKPREYWDFYKDKARRELWQKVYRGLRFKEDKVFVLSPDSRVLDFFELNIF
ncbi:MAG: helicase C-terminal domain-containing protein [Nanoarchaeota archaeon]